MLDIVGGSYYEYCWEPQWDELFGSGLRAAISLSQRSLPLRLYTYGDARTSRILETIGSHLGFETIITIIDRTAEFDYRHPLAEPEIVPSIQNNVRKGNIILEHAEKVLCFGMLEGNAVVYGKKVVYDPQAPGNPTSFWKNGSTADELVMVLNFREACALTGLSRTDDIISSLFDNERLNGLVIKMGPDGAVAINSDRKTTIIPVFRTDKVWTIGSGDIFTSQFAYNYLVGGMPIEESSLKASLATAWYSQHNTLPIPELQDDWNPRALKRIRHDQKKVYIAGPFFTMAERWLVNEFRTVLINMGVTVFSPLHDVGIGDHIDVAKPDLEGLVASDIILAILNNLDSGTLFEVGYARALNKPVIGFSENATRESLTMLYGTDCRISNDFTTVIYQVIWELMG